VIRVIDGVVSMIVEPEIITSSVRNVDFLRDVGEVEIEENGRDTENGDVVVVEVIGEGGYYDRAEVEGGEMVGLEVGQLLVGVLGERKAVQGFSSEIPERLEKGDELDFVSSGGVMAKCVSSPEGIGEPYNLKFLGFVTKDGKRVNISDYSLEMSEKLEVDCPLVLVASSRMDAGKTTLCCGLVKRFFETGKNVGALKLTGVTRQRDTLLMKKSGALKAYEFTDCGLPSSTGDSDKAVMASKGLINEVGREADVVVAELGAGLLSSYNVLEVLKDSEIKKACVSLVFMSLDPVGAYGGIRILEDHSYTPDVISGPSTDTEAGRENIRRFTDVPVLNGMKSMDEIFEIVRKKVFPGE